MARSFGVLATHSIWVGAVEATSLEATRVFPEPGQQEVDLKSVPIDEILAIIRRQIVALRGSETSITVGAGFPGIIRRGVIEESPNLRQLKGCPIATRLATTLAEDSIEARVIALNDTDALATGIAATRGDLEKLIRVWYLGDGVGFGHHPRGGGVWEAGHSVITLDPKERFCGCGGAGHLEGIVGGRAMRLRFLDMDPEEVFAAARHGDVRCGEFVKLWHRALAAATATSVHLEGPGRFYLAGPNAAQVDSGLLNIYLQEMIQMTPLQGAFFEIVPNSHDLALIGAAVIGAEG